MRPPRASRAAAVIAVLAIASAAGAGGLISRSTLGIEAKHGTHVSKKGVECTRCHVQAPSSTKSTDLLLPRHEACQECHEEATCEGPAQGGVASLGPACKKCHAGDPRTFLSASFDHAKEASIIFDHSLHYPMSNKGCRACHSFKAKKPGSANPTLPSMQVCLDCHPHDDAWDSDSCAPCHLADKDGTLVPAPGGKTLLPQAWMHGAAHDGSWAFDHGPAAALRTGFCAACHTDSDCASCHAGTAKPSAIHPGDWIEFHPVAANLGGLHCATCHGSQEFCLSCHQKAGVSWSSPTGLGVPAGDVFHPEGWYSFAGPGKHGKQAKKNLKGCASCHTEGDCTMCHSAQSTFSVSPHPGAGTWLKKCVTLAKKSPSTCLACHPAVPADCK